MIGTRNFIWPIGSFLLALLFVSLMGLVLSLEVAVAEEIITNSQDKIGAVKTDTRKLTQSNKIHIRKNHKMNGIGDNKTNSTVEMEKKGHWDEPSN